MMMMMTTTMMMMMKQLMRMKLGISARLNLLQTIMHLMVIHLLWHSGPLYCWPPLIALVADVALSMVFISNTKQDRPVLWWKMASAILLLHSVPPSIPVGGGNLLFLGKHNWLVIPSIFSPSAFAQEMIGLSWRGRRASYLLLLWWYCRSSYLGSDQFFRLSKVSVTDR